jgi:hypothetical protein
MDKLRVELRVHDRPLVMLPDMQVGTCYGAMVDWKGEEHASQLQDRMDAMVAKKLDETDIRKQLYGYY